MRNVGILLAILVGGAVSCHPSARGAVTAAGFQHDHYDYRVSKAGPTFLGDHWILDNYDRGPTGELVAKTQGIYGTMYFFDMDADGTCEYEKAALTYDLRFRSDERDAAIWLRTFPIASDFKRRDLPRLAKDYADAATRVGYEAVLFNDGRRSKERPWALELVSQEPATLAGREARLVRMEVTSAPGGATPTPKTTVEVVLAPTGFSYDVNMPGRSYSLPLLLVAGYASPSADFAGQEPTFRNLLSQIQIAGQRGFQAASDPVAASDAGSSPPAAPSVISTPPDAGAVPDAGAPSEAGANPIPEAGPAHTGT